MLEFKLPEVGENISSGQIVKICVSQGDAVKQEQTIIELETEKATIEIPSPADGTITEIMVNEGDTIQIGQSIAKIDTDESTQEPEPAAQEPVEEEKTEEKQEKNPPLQQTQTETPAPQPASESSIVNREAQNETPSNNASQDTNNISQIPKSFANVNAAPSVRRFARELGVDLHTVKGTGPESLITDEDVKAHVKTVMTSGGPAAAVSAVQPLPDFSKWGQIKREPMSNIRKTTAKHLSHAWQQIPHVTQFGKADISELDKLRKKHSTPENKLSITPFIMKVVAAALKQFPQFNASLDMNSQEIVYKQYINLGVAVDTENGLLVPVVRQTDKKSIFHLSSELKEIAERARSKKLGLDDMKGGCFTITNLGGLGAAYFTPVVNWPEVAILGICRAELTPCYQEATCAPRLMLPLALSYDHRIIDGADGARFMKWIADAIENPFMLELN